MSVALRVARHLAGTVLPLAAAGRRRRRAGGATARARRGAGRAARARRAARAGAWRAGARRAAWASVRDPSCAGEDCASPRRRCTATRPRRARAAGWGGPPSLTTSPRRDLAHTHIMYSRKLTDRAAAAGARRQEHWSHTGDAALTLTFDTFHCNITQILSKTMVSPSCRHRQAEGWGGEGYPLKCYTLKQKDLTLA